MLIFRPVLLLVEPSPTLRSSLSNWLNDMLPGYQIHSVSSGKEAIHLNCSERVSEVLIDMYLPDMPGPELIREIRRIHPCAAITVIGWQDNAILLEKLLSIGADRLISMDKLHSELIPLVDDSTPLFRSSLPQRKGDALPARQKD